LTSFFRIFVAIPIIVVLALLSGSTSFPDSDRNVDEVNGVETSEWDGGDSAAVVGGVVFIPTVLMLLFRRKYPRWWFDWSVELSRFGARVGSFLCLLRDEYPSTDEEQAVHLEVDYPDAQQLNRWLPLVKWLLAIPHYFLLFFLFIGAVLATIVAWFAILVTGTYPRGLFDFVVGVGRWAYRVQGYMLLLVTDRYPPFSTR
jgi:hypothetical protein